MLKVLEQQEPVTRWTSKQICIAWVGYEWGWIIAARSLGHIYVIMVL